MRCLISLSERYLNRYYNERNKFTGVSYFFRLYSLAKAVDLIFLKNYSVQRNEVRTMQKLFRDYWHEEINNTDLALRREKLSKMFRICEEQLPYVTQVFTKLEKMVEEGNYDTGFNPGKWRPLLIAVEEIE